MARDEVSGAPFTPEELVDQIAVLFLAGHETSASALGWSLYLLAASGEWQDKARAAVHDAFGDGAPDHAGLKALDPLRNVVREALRLYPPVSFLPRASATPVILRDKPVGPQDLLIVAPWLIHRNPETWECPHAFDPDRFTRESEAVRHAWLPFGQGERACVGAGFAMQEAMIVLARVVQKVKVAPAATPEVVSRLTLRARGGIHLHVTAL
jgi:cytochrome P450